MKQFFFFLMSAALLVSCGSAKPAAATSVPTSQIRTVTSLENREVREVEMELSGIEVTEVLSDDGTRMEKIPVRWFAGTYKSNNQRIAVEAAQRDAFNTVARTIETEIMSKAQFGELDLSATAQDAFKSFAVQASHAIVRGCAPYGKANIQYDPASGTYNVWAKVAIQGPQFQKMLKAAANEAQKEVSPEDVDNFVSAINKVMEAANF